VAGTDPLDPTDDVPPPAVLDLGAPSPGVAGALNGWPLTGGEPGATAFLVASPNQGFTPVPGCPGVALNLSGPALVDNAAVDPNGNAAFAKTIPAGLAGRTVFFQAVEPGTCRVSNVVIDTL